MIGRRTFIGTLAGSLLVAPCTAEAQQKGKVYRIGILGNISPPAPQAVRLWEAFAQGMHERGYNEGQNFVRESRWTEGRLERTPSLAAELVSVKVDLIVAVGTAAVRAAKQTTDMIPIVMVYVIDPVASGIIDSYARPGGNVTRVAFGTGLEIVGKHLELLKEAILKGAKPADLPVEQPTKFELVITT